MAARPVLIAATAKDPFVAELVRLLQSEGTEVLVIHNADSAMKAARSKQPALVVLDAVLPDGDGLSLCRRLKSTPNTSDIPVFCFSVLMARDRCVEAGADGFMLKPVEMDSLMERIRGILDCKVMRLPHRTK